MLEEVKKNIDRRGLKVRFDLFPYFIFGWSGNWMLINEFTRFLYVAGNGEPTKWSDQEARQVEANWNFWSGMDLSYSCRGCSSMQLHATYVQNKFKHDWIGCTRQCMMFTERLEIIWPWHGCNTREKHSPSWLIQRWENIEMNLQRSSLWSQCLYFSWYLIDTCSLTCNSHKRWVLSTLVFSLYYHMECDERMRRVLSTLVLSLY